MIRSFPHYPQQNKLTCGLTCIKIIAKYHKKIIDVSPYYKSLSPKGLSIHDLCGIAEDIGFRTRAYNIMLSDLESIKKPIIIHWNENHYVVLYKIKKGVFFVSDPAKGLLKYNQKDFAKNWASPENIGKVIVLEVSEKFSEQKNSKGNYLSALEFLSRHLSPYKRKLVQLLMVMIIISLVYACLPFITRSIIDVGIEGNDFNFITIVLVANICLLLFKSIGEWIRVSISLQIASRIKISIVTDYLIKVFSLPVSFIDSMLMGDIIQRSKDQERIQQFVSTSAVSVIMSIFIITIYSVILFVFNKFLFLIFFISTILYVLWVMFFYEIRKKMDIKYFQLMGENQSSWIEILKNFEDTKLNNYSLNRRWKWERIQGLLYKIEIKLLNIDRTQQLGADFINGIKDICLTFYGAYLVVQGDLTLGTFISIQFIISQLGTPVSELISFIRMAQSAFISFLRVNDINNMQEEQLKSKSLITEFDHNNNDIIFRNVSFRYKGASKSTLNNVTFNIPDKKITAIVGVSGCGKSTLLKLITKVYDEYQGEIYIGQNNLRNLDNDFLRKQTGVVFQESTLYKDTILNNIILSDEQDYDSKLIDEILPSVNLKNEIYALPDALNTQLSEGGKGLSQGQKQRLLLARALYKKPKLLILDEATNALDSISENKFLETLRGLKNQTTIVVSHKLSTIRCAGFIIMIDKGYIVDLGTYEQLIEKKSFFYNLFKDQMPNNNG